MVAGVNVQRVQEAHTYHLTIPLHAHHVEQEHIIIKQDKLAQHLASSVILVHFHRDQGLIFAPSVQRAHMLKHQLVQHV